MRSRLAVLITLGVALVFGLLFGRQAYLSRDLPRRDFELKKIRILTYATFAGPSGPGAELIAQFKKTCNCEVEVVTAGDAGILLERLKLAQAGQPFDLVIGVDQMLMRQAEEQFDWREMFFGNSGRHPVLSEYTSKHFVPYDWSPMTFVFRKGDFAVPGKLDDLLKPEFKKQFAIQDPRSSSPGLQFYNWIKKVKGDQTVAFLEKFRDNVHSISPSWAFSYGLFKKEQVRFVFSYLTSLAFHWGVENNREYRVLSLEEGHPVQVEYVAIPSLCRECDLAEEFVKHMMQPEAQKLIMEKNFMLPVIKGLEEGTIFGELPSLKTIQIETGKDLGDWDKVFKR
jgi:thiamine transport system substrate-binding protein